jgi:rare lipoprotein A
MRIPQTPAAVVALALAFSAGEACGGRAPDRSASAVPVRLASAEGLATYYGPGFHGELTASGTVFNQNHLVAAHPLYPFGTLVRVTNLENGRAVTVRIVDRGPVKRRQRDGVIIDLSTGAARRLRMVQDGIVKVRLDVLQWGGGDGRTSSSPVGS